MKQSLIFTTKVIFTLFISTGVLWDSLMLFCEIENLAKPQISFLPLLTRIYTFFFLLPPQHTVTFPLAAVKNKRYIYSRMGNLTTSTLTLRVIRYIFLRGEGGLNF